MKSARLILVLLLLSLILLITAVTAAPAGAGISSAPADTTGTPPQNVSSYISEATAAVAGQNWTGALLVATQGSAWYPGDANLLGLQGYSHRKMGQYAQAVDDMSRAISLDSTKPVRYANRAYAYLALKNYTAALADADAGIALDATYPVSYGVKALALQGQGRNTEAIAAIDTALVLSPDSAHYWQVKGRILASQGNCSGAAWALQKSIELDRNYVLPWPGFGSAQENLLALNTTCIPVTATPTPKKSPAGWIAVAGIIGGIIALGMRK
jgi:tetratricopeptide (TPR) repeat protein